MLVGQTSRLLQSSLPSSSGFPTPKLDATETCSAALFSAHTVHSTMQLACCRQWRAGWQGWA